MINTNHHTPAFKYLITVWKESAADTKDVLEKNETLIPIDVKEKYCSPDGKFSKDYAYFLCRKGTQEQNRADLFANFIPYYMRPDSVLREKTIKPTDAIIL